MHGVCFEIKVEVQSLMGRQRHWQGGGLVSLGEWAGWGAHLHGAGRVRAEFRLAWWGPKGGDGVGAGQ